MMQCIFKAKQVKNPQLMTGKHVIFVRSPTFYFVLSQKIIWRFYNDNASYTNVIFISGVVGFIIYYYDFIILFEEKYYTRKYLWKNTLEDCGSIKEFQIKLEYSLYPIGLRSLTSPLNQNQYAKEWNLILNILRISTFVLLAHTGKILEQICSELCIERFRWISI